METVELRHYYGEYNGGSVVVMIGTGAYSDALWGEAVACYTFHYNNVCTISVLRDGEFESLEQAYELGWLTEQDISVICSRHRELYPALYD